MMARMWARVSSVTVAWPLRTRDTDATDTFAACATSLIVTAIAAVGLTFTSSSYLLFTLLIIGALFLFGPHHPPTLDDQVPLGTTRLVLAVVGLIMLIVCFTPAPIEPFVMGQ